MSRFYTVLCLMIAAAIGCLMVIAVAHAGTVRWPIAEMNRIIDQTNFIVDDKCSGTLFGGNSGGALYDGDGRLIGVPAAGSQSATFIGLAIPIQSVKDFLKQQCLASIFDAKADDAACRTDREKKAAGGDK